MPKNKLQIRNSTAEFLIFTNQAKSFAESEFKKYRIIQDRLFKSDFDKDVKRIEGKL
jgi:hypothetical protein